MSRLIVVMSAMVCLGGCFNAESGALKFAKRSLDNIVDSSTADLAVGGRPNGQTVVLPNRNTDALGRSNDVVETFLGGRGDEVIVGRLYR